MSSKWRITLLTAILAVTVAVFSGCERGHAQGYVRIGFVNDADSASAYERVALRRVVVAHKQYFMGDSDEVRMEASKDLTVNLDNPDRDEGEFNILSTSTYWLEVANTYGIDENGDGYKGFLTMAAGDYHEVRLTFAAVSQQAGTSGPYDLDKYEFVTMDDKVSDLDEVNGTEVTGVGNSGPPYSSKWIPEMRIWNSGIKYTDFIKRETAAALFSVVDDDAWDGTYLSDGNENRFYELILHFNIAGPTTTAYFEQFQLNWLNEYGSTATPFFKSLSAHYSDVNNYMYTWNDWDLYMSDDLSLYPVPRVTFTQLNNPDLQGS